MSLSDLFLPCAHIYCLLVLFRVNTGINIQGVVLQLL